MIEFYLLSAEVPGYPGNNCKPAPHADVFTHLDYELDDFPHDCIFVTVFEHVIEERLADRLNKVDFTGAEIKEVEISFTEEYERHTSQNRNKKLPKYRWLKVTGKPGVDDFGIEKNGNPVSGLVVSKRVYDLIESFKLEWCDVYDYKTGSVVKYGKPTLSLM